MGECHQTKIKFPNLDSNIAEQLNENLRSEEKKCGCRDGPLEIRGPDGFPAGFYQKSWNIVGFNVCNYVKAMWSNSARIVEVNYIDLCLIPKVLNHQLVNQFRHISLFNIIYKVLSKIIVNRIKKIIDKIVSPYQTTSSLVEVFKVIL